MYIYIYIYTHTHTHTHTLTHTHTHARAYVAVLEIVYEIPLLQNNTVGETFLPNGERWRSCDWIVVIRAPAWR